MSGDQKGFHIMFYKLMLDCVTMPDQNGEGAKKKKSLHACLDCKINENLIQYYL